MHTHTVFFWLKDDSSQSVISQFEDGLKLLVTDPNIASCTYGRPANSEVRDVVDGSYTFGMVLNFEDTTAHDRYQVSPIHKRFIEDCNALWSRVQVYDIQD